MRKHALACFTILALLATAAIAQTPPKNEWYLTPMARSGFRLVLDSTPGMSGTRAAYIMGETNARYTTTHNAIPVLQRSISLTAWRGQHVRVSLRLKPEGKVYGWTSLALSSSDGSGLTSFRQRTGFGGGEWESLPFVLDVPANANKLYVDVGLSGEGKVWVDEVSLEAVGSEVALSNTRRTPRLATSNYYGDFGCTWNSGGGCGGYSGCNSGYSGCSGDYAFANPYNPYAGMAESTIRDLRAGSTLAH